MQIQKVNYQRELDRVLLDLERQAAEEGDAYRAPRLLLHSCCAPCSSYVMEYLREYFQLTVFYYNPNITAGEEYAYRLAEEKRLIRTYNEQVEKGVFEGMYSTGKAHPIGILEAPYDPDSYRQAVRGLEDLPEGGARCTACFRLRLQKTAEEAAKGGYDCFTTTLTISPLKDAQRLNSIGRECAGLTGTVWLPGDFKKKNGYYRSVELSRQFDLYRQDYCGCEFSRREQTERTDREEIQQI